MSIQITYAQDANSIDWIRSCADFYSFERSTVSNSAVWEYEKIIKTTKFSATYRAILKDSEESRSKLLNEIESRCKSKKISIETMHLTFLLCESLYLSYIEVIRWSNIDEWDLPYVIVSFYGETKFDPKVTKGGSLFDTTKGSNQRK